MSRRRSAELDVVLDIARLAFSAAAATCLLWAAHRMAAALMLTARVQALAEVDEALTVDEREELIRRIKTGALSRRP